MVRLRTGWLQPGGKPAVVAVAVAAGPSSFWPASYAP